MKKNVLVLAPHTDDGELGCGGSIVKLIEQQYRVIYIAFSAAEESVLPQFPRDVLRQEVIRATGRLGIQREDCIVLNFAVRSFPEKRQEILDEMIRFQREYRPEMVFLPSANDTHQDHQTIAQEGFRAFKKTTMFGYEAPWNHLDFRATCFRILTKEQVQEKIAALECYESQKHRSYATAEFVNSLAVTRGVQIGQQYAEAFEVVRLIE